MKKLFAIILMAAFMATGVACTNMSPTQQGVASGAALGTLGGAGVAAISGGSVGWGALARYGCSGRWYRRQPAGKEPLPPSRLVTPLFLLCDSDRSLRGAVFLYKKKTSR